MTNIRLNPLLEQEQQRLSPETRDLAKRYLTGAYQSRLQDCGFSLSAGFRKVPDAANLLAGVLCTLALCATQYGTPDGVQFL